MKTHHNPRSQTRNLRVKQAVRYFLWSVCVGIALTVLPASFADNLLSNADFSQVDPAGKFVAWKPGWTPGGQQEVDQTVFKSEPASVKITQTDFDQYTLVCQRVVLKPDTQYRVSFWMKGEQIVKGPDGIGAMLLIGDADTQKSVAGASLEGRSKGAEGTFDWTKVEFEFTNRTAAESQIYLYLHHSTGTVWYDDVSLEEVLP